MMQISYTKMSGAGNTFIMCDGRALPEGADLADLARRVCDESLEHGGADGFIALYPASTAGDDFEMRYYNRDGSTGMMCGNGGRCAVRYAADLGLVHDALRIGFTNAGLHYIGAITGRGVRVSFPNPRRFELRGELELFGAMHEYHFADVGTPHAILFAGEQGSLPVAEVREVDVEAWGRAVRHHQAFVPEGANANFVQVLPENEGILLRTFERGVEEDTGACGTGAISSAIVTSMLFGILPPIAVVTSSGATLWVDFVFQDGGTVTNISLEGGAEEMMRGEVSV